MPWPKLIELLIFMFIYVLMLTAVLYIFSLFVPIGQLIAMFAIALIVVIVIIITLAIGEEKLILILRKVKELLLVRALISAGSFSVTKITRISNAISQNWRFSEASEFVEDFYNLRRLDIYVQALVISFILVVCGMAFSTLTVLGDILIAIGIGIFFLAVSLFVYTTLHKLLIRFFNFIEKKLFPN